MSTKTRAEMVDRIIVAAITVLQRDGMLGLTQPQIAKAAGLRQSHLTYYFPTRRDLVAGVAEAVAAELFAAFEAELRNAKDVGALAGGIARVCAAERTRLLLAFVLAADREDAVRRLFRGLTAKLRKRMAASLSHLGLAADREAVAMFHALCVGLAVLDLARGDASSCRELKSSAKLALAGLEPRRKRS
jgi:AcrR family transcriptional regulator